MAPPEKPPKRSIITDERRDEDPIAGPAAPDDDPGLEPLIKIYDDCIANNYIINEDGDWIDANGQLLDKAEAAARELRIEIQPLPDDARGRR